MFLHGGGVLIVRHEKRTGHHARPRSRGGKDNRYYPGNEIMLPENKVHRAFHDIFGNMRTNEVIRLLLTEWNTTCPHNEKNHPNTDRRRLKRRISAWDKLIGANVDGVGAAKIIIQTFVSTKDDEWLVEETLKDCHRSNSITRGELRYLLRHMGIE